MNVGVIGAGYVGLVAAACFAESGNEVICADIAEGKIAALNRGEIPIYEPGLDELVETNASAGRLTFTTDIAQAIRGSEVIFIAVGTPQDTDGSADLKFVLGVAETIGKNMNGPKIVVNKSTVPVGTADLVARAVFGRPSAFGDQGESAMSDDTTTAAVLRGTVKLASDAGDAVLHAGQQGTMARGQVPTRGPAPPITAAAG